MSYTSHKSFSPFLFFSTIILIFLLTTAGVIYVYTEKFSTLYLGSCETGFHQEDIRCLPDTKLCAIRNGNGKQYWKGSWGDCLPYSCNNGFTLIDQAHCTIDNTSYNVYQEDSLTDATI